MAEHRVASGDVELAVVEAGDPAHPALLLLHGYPDTKEVWTDVAARLAPRYHVITYDTRGAGSSSAPGPGRGVAGYGLECLVDDALAVLDAVCPGKAVHLVGHDWGSIAGWELATSDRGAARLASFTSVSGPCLDHFGHWVRDGLRHPTPARLAALAGQARRSWYVVALSLPGAAPLAWRTVLGRRWPEWMARAEGVPEGDHSHPAPTVALDGERGAGLYRANIGRRLRAPRPDPVARVPVQLVVATRDRYISPAVFDGVERWAPDLRRWQLDARHWVPRTHPEVLAGWVAEFVGDVEEARNRA